MKRRPSRFFHRRPLGFARRSSGGPSPRSRARGAEPAAWLILAALGWGLGAAPGGVVLGPAPAAAQPAAAPADAAGGADHGGAAAAVEKNGGGGASRGPGGLAEITPPMRQAVQKGMAYLASEQAADGSYGGGAFGRHVGITALACLGFMADGNLPGRGPYGDNVKKGLDFILNHATDSGLIAAETSRGPMYGHGFATLFLGEVYGQTRDPRVHEVLLKAIRLIVNTQNDEGGWRYQPIPFNADISVTIAQIMALRSARNAGVYVPKKTINKAVEYVKACQNASDGGFRYMLQGSGSSAFPRSAAGVASLYYAGIYEGQAVTKGLKYLQRHGRDANGGGYYYYGNYYAIQAMFLAGGPYWAKWYPRIRDELISKQAGAGYWTSNYGPAYGTAMALIILQMPNRFLPIFQR